MYLGGGAMAGVFSGGVLNALDKLDFQENVEAVYAVSAGALNAAYFLTKQTDLGSSIYLEDLPGRFILPFKIPLGLFQLFWNRFIKNLSPESKIYNVIDVDYLFNVVKNKKRLDISELKKQKINFYIKLLNISTGDCEYLNIRDGNPLMILRAAVDVKPYYFPYQIINKNSYVDGGIKEQFGIDYLLDKYPRNKIIAIFNEPIYRRMKYNVKNFLEGLISTLYPYKVSLFKFFRNREYLMKIDIAKALDNPRVLLIYPPRRNGILQLTKKPRRLMKHHQLGIKEAKEILDFINN